MSTVVQPPKRLLLGPGPSMVDPRVYAAMQQPVVGYTDPYFFQLASEISQLLRPVFGTDNEYTFAVTGTGGAGMEAALANFIEEGTRVAVLVSGFFASRMAEVARRHGAEVVTIEKPWGEVFSDDEAADFILKTKPQVVAYVQAETSTGAFQEGKAICEAAHQVGAIVIADCVTSLGAMPVLVDETGIDVAYSCTQKGLSCPPGLAPITLSDRAIQRLKQRKKAPSTWYLDLQLLIDYYWEPHRYHHTVPVSLFYALREALAVIHEEKLDHRWARHLRNHRALVAGLEAMGLRMLVEEPYRLWSLNTPVVPEGVDELAVRKTLLENWGIEILGGFGPRAGNIWRIGLMGASSTEENVLLFLEKFQQALEQQGYQPPASGKEAAMQFYASEPAVTTSME